MANCNKLFLDFEKKISLTKSRKEKLATSRIALEDKIRKAISEKENVKFKGFYIQGSMSKAFGTAVLKEDNTYDVDLGVYYEGKPNDITCTTAQKYIYDAVADHTEGGASHLKKCIRVNYAGDFDIDLPVYYIEKNNEIPFLAIKNADWRKDDMKGMAEWFRAKKKDTDGQLVRIIRYLKIWADSDLRGFKMPNGIALTVWVANYFVKNDRDDKSLLETLKKIKDSFTFLLYPYYNITCKCPKEPYDDLVSNLDDTQKGKFYKALGELIKDAEKAIDSKNQLEASKLWQKHLGSRFPDGADEDIDAKEAQLRQADSVIKSNSGKLNKEGIFSSVAGVPLTSHRNFGK